MTHGLKMTQDSEADDAPVDAEGGGKLWYVATEFFAQGGEPIIGPFESDDLALRVRDYVEKAGSGQTFAVDWTRERI